MENINKQHFLLAGSCAVVRSVFSRSSLGGKGQGIREVKEIGILRKVLFHEKAPEYQTGAINASAEQMLRLKSAGMFW